MAGASRWISSMKSTSRSPSAVRIAARSPGRSMTGPCRRSDGDAELVRDDGGQRRLAEPGRAVEQRVVERLAAVPRRGDRDLQVLSDPILADVVVERAGPEPGLVLDVLVDARRSDDAV